MNIDVPAKITSKAKITQLPLHQPIGWPCLACVVANEVNREFPVTLTSVAYAMNMMKDGRLWILAFKA